MKIALSTLRYLQETLDTVRDNVTAYGEFHGGTIEVTIDGQRFKAKWDGDGEWDVEEVEKPKRARKVTAKTTMTPALKESLAKDPAVGGKVQGAKGPVDPARQARAKKAAATRAANRAAKAAQS